MADIPRVVSIRVECGETVKAEIWRGSSMKL